MMIALQTSAISAEPLVRYIEVDVVADKAGEFERIVTKGMQEAMLKEDGVLAMYAVAVKGEPNKFRFFEIYANEAAYEKHRNTPHFKQYIEETQAMVTRKDFIDTDNVLLLNKANFGMLKDNK